MGSRFPTMSHEEIRVSSVERQPFELRPAPGRVIRGDVRSPDPGSWVSRRAVVVCHGFKGFKDWGFFPYLSDRLAADTGATVVSFNFSGSGIGPDLENFTDLDGFSHNTFSLELDDLKLVLDALQAGRLRDVTFEPPARVGLIGHSRGAAAAILVGSVRPEVSGIVTWGGIASVFRYESWFADQLGDGDLMYVTNARTGQELPIRRDVLTDMRRNASRLDMIAAAGSLQVPLLIVHGSEDEAVPLSEASRLSEAANTARLEVIQGASHTMDAAHPFPGTNPSLEKALNLTSDHFLHTFALEGV